ncbi:hypothetical protein TSUD_208420 [Trifolium subterraneum]|uniref:RNase H type-1 domain-containing protein n=1 Tax=Trifolium subterraneum TaxID=3900 RepID=A0A2Z6N4T0_TRISU|nr:hypothetical protein TSUD_208420 [Trifolium subterraneum]
MPYTHLNKIENLRYALEYDYCFTVDRDGRGGGVAVMWRKVVNCSITNYSLNHIDIEVDDLQRGKWRLTGFYGYPEGSRRRDSWNFLRQLSNASQLPWCIIGDFNDILSSDEKQGRSQRPQWLINGFREAVSDSGLVDIHWKGYPFTWFKSLGTERAVEEKLDRAMANDIWCNMFQYATVECLTTTASDHYPLLLECDPKPIQHRHLKQFKFENAWFAEPEFDTFVKQHWETYGNTTITRKLDDCASDLTSWSGHKWSIGTGHNISLWDQNWLSDGTSIKKPDNIDSQLNNLTVADLLHHNAKEWDSGLIRGLLNDDIADKILHTPLLESVQNDKITWQHEKNGLYTVKSAYRFCISTIPGRDQHRVEGKWHLIWQTQMPPKIKNFMWRICRNCLPTRARLHDRGVTCPINCVLCDAGDEDSNHLFFSCQNSINCWQQMGLWSSIMQHRNLTISVKENVFNIMLQLNEDSRAVFACVMWSIWKQRNDVIWRNERVHRTVVCERANSLLTGWRNAREVRDRYNNQQHSPQRFEWTRPDAGTWKCNVDASFSRSRNKVGIGVCIRDDQGQFVLAKTEWYSPILDVDTGEALGLLSALKWVKDLHLNSVVFELDSKRVVDKFNNNMIDESVEASKWGCSQFSKSGPISS